MNMSGNFSFKPTRFAEDDDESYRVASNLMTPPEDNRQRRRKNSVVEEQLETEADQITKKKSSKIDLNDPKQRSKRSTPRRTPTDTKDPQNSEQKQGEG